MSEVHFEIRTNSGIIRGMRHMPPSPPRAVVIIVHGYFSATRVGPARLHVLLARTLSEHGYAVIRFDFLGVGDSDGNFENITFSDEIRDLHNICDYVGREFRDLPLILCGHSMGANLALRVAYDRNDIEKLILIAPDVYKTNGVDSLFTEEQSVDLKYKGWTLRKGLYINNTFIDEIRLNNPLDIASKVSIPVIVVQGDDDELYSMEGANLLSNSAQKGILIRIENGDHNFLHPTARSNLMAIFPSLLQEGRGEG